jgi:hypothetical protein
MSGKDRVLYSYTDSGGVCKEPYDGSPVSQVSKAGGRRAPLLSYRPTIMLMAYRSHKW